MDSARFVASRMRRMRAFVSCAMLCALAACASSGAYRETPPIQHRPLDGTAVMPSSRILDATALRSTPHPTLLAAITTRWPNLTSPPWTTRTMVRFDNERVGVYANEMPVGGLDYLRDLPTSAVTRVLRLTPTEELTRFGRQHPAGALVIEWARIR